MDLLGVVFGGSWQCDFYTDSSIFAVTVTVANY